jgi:hypothetical protein
MSLSYSRRIGTVRTFVSAGLGLTESVPDVTLAVGWRLSLG